jgi:hypothetical protein
MGGKIDAKHYFFYFIFTKQGERQRGKFISIDNSNIPISHISKCFKHLSGQLFEITESAVFNKIVDGEGGKLLSCSRH